MTFIEQELQDVRKDEQLDLENLTLYLKNNLKLQFDNLAFLQFSGGHANLTYLLKLDEKEYVMSKVEEDIYDIVADKADVDRVKLVRDARLDDLEIESLDIVEIIFAIEEKFDIQIPYNANDAEMEFETVGQVVDAVQKVIEEQS